MIDLNLTLEDIDKQETPQQADSADPALLIPPDAPQVGVFAALAIEQCCNASAQRVLAAASDFATLNAQVQEEATLLSQQIIAEGKRWASFMERATALAKTIHISLSAERARIATFVANRDVADTAHAAAERAADEERHDTGSSRANHTA